MNAFNRLATSAAVLAILSGCAVTSLDESARRTAERVAARTDLHPDWQPAETAAPVPEAPLDVAAALRHAFAHNADTRRLYARLGLAQADVESAARVANPRLSFAWLDPSGGGRDKTTRGIVASFTDLLLLPSRRRLSAALLERTELLVADSLLALAKDVEVAWYAEAGAGLAAGKREEAAQAAESAASLAARYREAGNIPQRELDEARMLAADARIAALAAQARAVEARARLANLLGLASADAWRTTRDLPAPPEAPLAAEGLGRRAQADRFDLAAAALEVRTLEAALSTAKSGRLLGLAEAGYEQERETDGAKLAGPTLALELPLFDQGQGRVARAQAQLLDARARRDALALAIGNEVAAGVARLELARAVADQERRVRLPAAISAAARSEEDVNFMLEDPFGLARAEGARLAAEAGSLEAVSGYWIARAELRAAAGGSLPGDKGEDE